MTDSPVIVRSHDWEERLRTYLDRIAEDRFAWGRHDCALFSAGAIKAMSGVDPAEAYRGTYDTGRGAALALRQHGAGTLLKTVKSWLGEAKPISLAQRGDVVMRDRTTCGICVGQHSYFVGREIGHERLIVIPTRDCRYAFSVPFEAVSNG